MQAILMTAVGAPDVLQLLETPEPEITQPTQVKVKLHAAGVNPIDTKLRQGGLLSAQTLPAILGCDGAGEVVAIGAKVTHHKVGDKVWFCHGGLGLEPGCYAQYNVLDQRWVTAMPESLSFTEAAAAPLVLITAWGALVDRGGLKTGQTVLIHAGAGGVGHVAIQIAKLLGARVITTVGSAEKAAFVRQLGADEIINYRQENFVVRVNELTGGQGAHLVLDTVGAEIFKRSINATAHFGRLITLLDPGQLDLSEARLRNLLIGFELMLTPMLRNLDAARVRQVKMLDQCAEWIDQGKLQIHISQKFLLSQAAEAHSLIEAGHVTGKLVLEIKH
ncbi:MAG: zinc-dependent alcohol dehydrogenase family protein [Methylococcales bacterium]